MNVFQQKNVTLCELYFQKLVLPLYDISQYLVKLIQPTLIKSKYKITNSSSVVNEAKNWLARKEMKSKCLDIINLYPSVPIDKALDGLKDQLNNDKDNLMNRTKLCLKDIYQLAELFLSKYYFYGTMKLEY